MGWNESKAPAQHRAYLIFSFECLVVSSTRLKMEAFKLLKKDFIIFGIIQGKRSTKWNQYARAFVWIFSFISTILSYLICALFESEKLNEQTEAFFFGLGNIMLLVSTIFLMYRNQSVMKLLADLDTIVGDREYFMERKPNTKYLKFAKRNNIPTHPENEDLTSEIMYSATAAKIDKLTKLMYTFFWKFYGPLFYLPNVLFCVYGFFYDENFTNDSFYLSSPMW